MAGPARNLDFGDTPTRDAPAGHAALDATNAEHNSPLHLLARSGNVREQRVDRLEEAGAWGPAPTRQFVVNASLRWNPSSFAIQRGESYRVDVLGPQRWVDGFVKIDADGYPAHYDAISQCWVAAGRCRPYLGARKRLPDADWFALVCGVGDYVWKLQEDELDPTFLPLREAEVSATLFFVGHYLEFTAVDDGELICFANDADHLYWNNQGQLVVDVARTSWPPTRYTNYEAYLSEWRYEP